MMHLIVGSRYLPWTTVWTIVNICTFIGQIRTAENVNGTFVLKVKTSGTLQLGQSFTLICYKDEVGYDDIKLWWTVNDIKNLSVNSERKADRVQVQLHFDRLAFADFGNYSCNNDGPFKDTHVDYKLSFFVPQKLEIDGSNITESREFSTTKISCFTTGFPIDTIIWTDSTFKQVFNSSDFTISGHGNSTYQYTSLLIREVKQAHNGTYFCTTGDHKLPIDILVVGPPVVSLDLIKAVGKSQIFISWIIDNKNSPVIDLDLEFYGENGSHWVNSLNTTLTSYILGNLNSSTIYRNFSLMATNLYGNTTSSSELHVATLAEDPKFVPEISVKGYTSDTITLGWDTPISQKEFFHFYKITIQGSNGNKTVYFTKESPHLAERLKPWSNYIFQVQACSNFTKLCDSFSNEVNGTTMDGIASSPEKLSVTCRINQRTHESVVKVVWEIPSKPEGIIMEYVVTLIGKSSYPDDSGKMITEDIGPAVKTVQSTEIDFFGHLPNTDIFISVCAKTRSRRCGAAAEGACSIPRSIPNTDDLSKADWKLIRAQHEMLFMINMPHISQRNGPICCLRVIVIRLQNAESMESLEPPDQSILLNYNEVHNNTVGGAYLAEMLDFPSEKGRSIMIGDNNPKDADEPSLCRKCRLSQNFNGSSGYFRTSYKSNLQKVRNYHKRELFESQKPARISLVHDGPLDIRSTYTAYLEALVVSDQNELLRSRSKYFLPLRPMIEAETADSEAVQRIIYAIFASVAVSVLVILMSVICVSRLRRKVSQDPDDDLSESFFFCCGRLRNAHALPSYEILEMAPVLHDQLVSAYLERHKNFDSGFKIEFESLPEHFADRTSTESEKRENIGKNRYPDIKAYDETRVRLTPIDKIPGSEYINANFVEGYKGKKNYICAQGPMEVTVNDWWRMIWEQRIHLILMLTNTEEYNKTKCAKYWPSEGTTAYGDVTVTHYDEKAFSEYLVRSLKISHTEPGSSDTSEREVIQYHYLLWKDFLAPEYPIGIVRFIKRFNEVKNIDSGPVLVHCSAGVGRTGTLVALDTLLDQLEQEGCVSIFNTICHLRHQRNYLVQSLKQYIFIYRALMETSQFGDTEIPLCDLKLSIEKLRSCEDGTSTSLMQKQFESLSHVIEDRKPFKVGTCEENQRRNRHENIIPYDVSRVILSPVSGENNETYDYINASFVEGYEKMEKFIMAQHPLEGTIADFWRMVVEQSVEYVVMLSDTGDEKCPRYWPEKDQETNHDHIRVKYMQSQSFPFYYRREFTVTNTKTDYAYLVTQFQYNSWPTGDDAVPESPRGLVELVDTLFKLKRPAETTAEINSPPMIVHCSSGADRSCVLVAFMILVQQMIKESRVDVFSTIRKMRSQRQGLFQNFGQYELVYRGLGTYTELHISNGNV